MSTDPKANLESLISFYSQDVLSTIQPSTLNEYDRYIRRFVREIDKSMGDVTRYDIREWFNSHGWGRRHPPRRPESRQVVVQVAHRRRRVSEDPAAAIPTVKQRERPTRASDDGIRSRLVAACTSQRDVALIELLHATGLRISEASALKVTDVDLETGAVVVAKSKNGKVRAAGLFSPTAVEAMGKWLCLRATMTDTPDEGPLWLTRAGTPMKHAGIVTVVRRIAERADVKFSPHDARRGWAVESFRRGANLAAVMTLAGWSHVDPCAGCRSRSVMQVAF